MEKEQIISELKSLVTECEEKILITKFWSEGYNFASYCVDYDIYSGWHTRALSFIRIFLPEDSDYIRRFVECEKNNYVLAKQAFLF